MPIENSNHIKDLIELEALADLMAETAARVKKNAREERLKLTGSSLPVVRKGLTEKQIAQVLADRRKSINKKSGIPGRITA